MIYTSLSPNTEADDIWLALKLLASPWRWKKGAAVRELEKRFGERVKFKHNFAFSSGRSALWAILLCLDLKSDDEVILQAFTCVAVPDAVIWAGAKPVFADCEEASLNMSPENLEKKITANSRVIIVQHTLGRLADMAKITAIAKQHNLIIIEDCAHALGGEKSGQAPGGFSQAAFFSFGRDKVISSVFGGLAATNSDALAAKLLNRQKQLLTPSALWVIQQLLHPLILAVAKKTYNFFSLGKIFLELAKRLSLISKAVEANEKQTGRPYFLNKRLPNALVVLALNQFKKINRFNDHRKKITELYHDGLNNANHFRLPEPLADNQYYLRYPIITEKAGELIKAAKKQRIELGNWYDAPIAPRGVDYKTIHYQPGSCPTAEKLSRQILNLPTHINLSEQDALKIVEFIRRTAQ